MKALLINKYGGPEVLTLGEIPAPVAESGKILVQIKFAGINPVDFKIRKGMVFFLSGFKFPKILGGDIAGIVENQPEGSPYKSGDRVFAMLNFKGGGYAGYAAIPSEWLCKIPENVGFRDAAALPLAGLTALQSLKELGKIRTGVKVLINGASGGVGHLAVQIAKWYGAEVTAVCSGKNKDWVLSLGADNVVDYTEKDPMELTEQFDIVFDAVAKLPVLKAGKLLKEQGVYISTMPLPLIFIRQLLNVFSGKKFYAIMAKPSGKDLELLSNMMAGNALMPFVERVYALSQGKEAHQYIESERVRGKLVFDLNL
ncbi:MAG TPA: NAD(P)-dependent alcohol dehydrogenase [Saprospiraceae bacterium]|nr:NAD(P)-dependent alcohol dehydrogenase [Saprospiraceae bacterium]